MMICGKSFEELIDALSPEIEQKYYDNTGNNKIVLRLPNRAIMNWFTSTGTLQFQGPKDVSDGLKTFVEARLREPHNKKITYKISVAIGSEADPADNLPVRKNSEVSNVQTEHIASVSHSDEHNYLFGDFNKTELFVGIVSPVGTPLTAVHEGIRSNIEGYGYKFIEVRLSSLLQQPISPSSEYTRISELMKQGDLCRCKSERNDIMAMAAIDALRRERQKTENQGKKLAFYINSLKHPDEVHFLRKIYGQSFYLIGIHADKKRKLDHLTSYKHCKNEEAEKLIAIDEDENVSYGQKTRDVFHLADFFLNVANNPDLERAHITRFFEIIFSNPYKNPTFDEFAMFMAFSCSVRSADLSRQVGAVLTKNEQIIATGVNDCPKAGGGQYWAYIEGKKIIDTEDGKDYTRGYDANKQEQQKIIDKILIPLKDKKYISEAQEGDVKKILADSGIKDLVEFGRVVHAEMETLLSCARAGINTQGATLYCTTFPCHNCAKHIIDAGVGRVVYVEPYPKSKALELHNDSIEIRNEEVCGPPKKVLFEAFQGVAARRFLDLFSMNLGTGNKIKRKDAGGQIISWEKSTATLRVSRLSSTYEKLEESTADEYGKIKRKFTR